MTYRFISIIITISALFSCSGNLQRDFIDLQGNWRFQTDDSDKGETEKWYEKTLEDKTRRFSESRQDTTKHIRHPKGAKSNIDFAYSGHKIQKHLPFMDLSAAKGISMEISEESAKRMAPFAEKHKLFVIFHNHGQPGDPNFSFDRVLAHGSYLRLNFDAGHYYGATGLNPCDLITRLHDKIVSIHMKDKTGKNDTPKDRNQVWGKGTTPSVFLLTVKLSPLNGHCGAIPSWITWRLPVLKGLICINSMIKDSGAIPVQRE